MPTLTALLARVALAVALGACLEPLLLRPALAHPDHRNGTQSSYSADHDHSGSSSHSH